MTKKDTPVVTMTKEEMEKAKTDTANFTSIQWLDSITLNMGKLTKDKEIEITWRFKNTGNKNLIIESASATDMSISGILKMVFYGFKAEIMYLLAKEVTVRLFL